jgi:cytoskeleton protein RodZ
VDNYEMEQDKITTIEPKPDKSLIWTGQRLRQAREALNLSQRDVARQLHLNVDLIRALEDNNEEALPSQTYLLGYLRNYARLLKLPVDKIIDAGHLVIEPTTTLLPENIDYRPQYRFEPRLRLVLLGMLIILLLAAGLWILVLGPEWVTDWFKMAARFTIGSKLSFTIA